MKTQPIIIDEIKEIINKAQITAIRAVDHQRVLMYWNIGKRIFEEEQHGRDRAVYGEKLIGFLADELKPQFGEGFAVRNLNRIRQFYRKFPIVSTVWTQLSWSHFRFLLTISSDEKIEFYLQESIKNNWTARQLDRQIGSQLYERLLLSTDKEKVLSVARNEQQPDKPQEIIKDPMILEFLGLKPEAAYYEKDLENGLITHLQEFMLELGNGFSFVARQKRIHLDGDDFFVDLVFYNRLLQCFVIIELKTHKITHQDLGQLQMYVNYYAVSKS